ncbi:MAG TPA: nucleotidyltransferase family protein [Solirubrobacteraceae bacterium]
MIAGLILAAGAGTRFGSSDSKLLASLEGRPLLEHAVGAACAVDELERIVVVLGAQADVVRQHVEFGRAEPVVCDEWDRGQSMSLRCGAAALSGAEKVIVTLGDEPLITPAVIRRFLNEPGGTRAVYHGRPGHPVVLGRAQLRALSELSGDRGARELLNGDEIECSALSSGRDVDTPGDLEAIRDEVRAVI